MISIGRPSSRVAPIIAIVVLLASCAAPDGGDPAAQPSPTPDGSTATAPSQTPPADTTDTLFHGEAPTLDGGTIDLATLAGRDVAAWFWAPW